MDIKTPIIPIRQTFANIQAHDELNLEAICVFASIGFFLDSDTYWKNKMVLKPAQTHTIDSNGGLVKSESWFKWHYSPRSLSFSEALEEFSDLFETIVSEQSLGKNVILPLSGGLDSRTQAVALRQQESPVFSYSYAFENGYPETKIARKIAKACDFNFREFVIPKGYLWNNIDRIAELNKCYSDFTHPRQLAIIDEFKAMGDQFSLGHWGDVLFDSMNLPQLKANEEVDVLMKKIFQKED